MIKGIAIVVAVVALLIAAIYMIGLVLPRDHVAVAERRISADPDTVARLVRTVEDYPRWRSGVTGIDVKGRDATGVRFVESGSDDPIAYHLTEEAAGKRFRNVITDETLPFGGFWTISLTPQDGGTSVRIEERGFVPNPVYRFFSAFVFGHDRSMRTWLDDLERHVPQEPSKS